MEDALKKGVEAHKLGQLDEAERFYTAVLKVEPEHPEANHNLGFLALSLGKIEKALPFLRKALQVNNESGQFWVSYIDALIRSNQKEEAKKYLKQARAKGGKGDAFDNLEKKLQALENTWDDSKMNTSPVILDPSPNQLQSLIKIFTEGKYQEVLVITKELIQDFPKSITLYNIQGAAYTELKQFDLAINNYRLALKIEPESANIYNSLGIAFKGVGDLKAAIESYKKAISIKPNSAEVHYNLGNAQKDIGDFKAAIGSYENAVKIKPDYAESILNLGIALRNEGNMISALEKFNQALDIKPDYSEAHYNIGNIFKAEQTLDAAIKSYREALKIKPDFFQAHNNLGLALYDNAEPDAAKDSYKNAIKIKPDYADAFYNLYGTAETLSEAKSWIEKCLKADKSYLRAKLTLSALKYYEGDTSDFDKLIKSSHKSHEFVRSFSWAFSIGRLPKLYFNRWKFFDAIVKQSFRTRPFYEYGVWRGHSFKYLIKTFKKGFGFDTFEGLPEDWYEEKMGTYSSYGNIPEIEGGQFIAGKFQDTLPLFFSKNRPLASLINFDADLYTSTIFALNYSRPIIDKHTILVFDQFIINKNWEEDEFKALNEFCNKNNYSYEILGISFFTKQVAVKLKGL